MTDQSHGDDDGRAEMGKAREIADRLRDCLPRSVDVASLGVLSKAPFILLCAREALIWRTEELARNACDTLERDDFTVAATLTRGILENAALMWKLMELLEARQKYSLEELGDLFKRALLGSREWDEVPDPWNVLTLLDHMGKTIPGTRERYESLSEIAHPNWAGVLGLYSKIDQAQFVAHFGRGLRTEPPRKMIVNMLLASLAMFEHAYNRIADHLPAFLAELEPIRPGETRGPQNSVT